MTKKSPLWLRLDNSAKIYPAASGKSWSNVFRESATLKEEIDTAVLRSALNITVKRFPSIAARLRKGAFWYYIQELEEAPDIRPEQSYPLEFMSKKEMRKSAMRVIVYKNNKIKPVFTKFIHILCFAVLTRSVISDSLRLHGL